MSKPTLQDVKEYFKNAKEVRCVSDKKVYNITKNITKKIYQHLDSFWIDKDNKDILLYGYGYNDKKEYAEIISYKEPLYRLTAKEIVHAYENPQYLKDTFKECFVPEYTIQEAEEKFNIKIKAV